jgi:hypothetical protein
VQQVKVPNLALSNIEYLCLKMHTHPGMPGTWYLGQLHRYRFGGPGKSSWGAMYLAPTGSYRGRLFIDEAPKLKRSRTEASLCSKKGSYRLLPVGVGYARTAAAKIGITL